MHSFVIFLVCLFSVSFADDFYTDAPNYDRQDFVFVGCYDFNSLDWEHQDDNSNTFSCLQICYEGGYEYSALGGHQCFCTNNIVPAPSTYCNLLKVFDQYPNPVNPIYGKTSSTNSGIYVYRFLFDNLNEMVAQKVINGVKTNNIGVNAEIFGIVELDYGIYYGELDSDFVTILPSAGSRELCFNACLSENILGVIMSQEGSGDGACHCITKLPDNLTSPGSFTEFYDSTVLASRFVSLAYDSSSSTLVDIFTRSVQNVNTNYSDLKLQFAIDDTDITLVSDEVPEISIVQSMSCGDNMACTVASTLETSHTFTHSFSVNFGVEFTHKFSAHFVSTEFTFSVEVGYGYEDSLTNVESSTIETELGPDESMIVQKSERKSTFLCEIFFGAEGFVSAFRNIGTDPIKCGFEDVDTQSEQRLIPIDFLYDGAFAIADIIESEYTKHGVELV